MLVAGVVFLHATRLLAGENIALHKRYEWNMAPNYVAATDRDKEKLTDGARVDAVSGAIWTDKNACVAWCSDNPQIEIVLDLEKTEPIEEVRLSTQYSPDNGLFLPGLVIGVSDDGLHFKQAAAWSPTGTVAQKGMERYTIAVTGIRASGRYVKVCLLGIRSFLVFADELEVVRGRRATDAIAGDGLPAMPESATAKMDVIAGATHANAMRTMLAEAKARIHDGKMPERIRPDFDQLAAEVGDSSFLDRAAYERLFQRFCALQGRAAGEAFDADFVLWPKNPWVGHQRHAMPDAAQTWDHSLNVRAMINEYESVSFMLSNTSDRDATYRVAVEPTAGNGSWAPGRLVLRRAYFAKDMDFREVPDVLPLMENGQLAVPAGQSQEIWLTLQTKDQTPGEHRIDVTVRSASQPTAKTVQVRVNIAPIRFPDQVPLTVWNWSYIYADRQFLRDARQAAIADLMAHYTNTFPLGDLVTPFPAVDKDGNFTTPPDFAKLGQAIQDLKGAKYIAPLPFWIASPGAPVTPFRGEPLAFMSPPWKKAYAEWLRQLVAYMKSQGVDYSQFFYEPVDETAEPRAMEIVKLTKSVDPNVKIMLNTPEAAESEVAEFVDMVAPSHCTLAGWAEDFLAGIGKKLAKTHVREFWTYSCGAGARSFSPYTYYRLMPWRIWSAGGNGCGFFFYVDCRSDSTWSIDHVDYGVVYDAASAPDDIPRSEPLIPTRRWEAWREGIEDYTYLFLLDALTKKAKRDGADPSRIQKAETVLASMVQEILAGEHDAYGAKDAGGADRARELMLREIETLADLPADGVLDGNLLTPSYRPIGLR